MKCWNCESEVEVTLAFYSVCNACYGKGYRLEKDRDVIEAFILGQHVAKKEMAVKLENLLRDLNND